MLSKAYLDIECEVVDVVGKTSSELFYVIELERVFLEGVAVKNIYWFGLLYDLHI